MAVVSDSEVLAGLPDDLGNGRVIDGSWSEVWTLDSCGTSVDYEIDFTADGRGGTFFGVSMVWK